MPSSYTRQIEPGVCPATGMTASEQVPTGDAVALADPVVDGDSGLLGDGIGVGIAGDHRSAGGLHDLGEGSVVVPVLVGGDHGREAAVADQLEQTWGLVGGVDQDLVSRVGAPQEVAVVRHLRVDGDLRDLQGAGGAGLGVAAGGDLAGVVVLVL